MVLGATSLPPPRGRDLEASRRALLKIMAPPPELLEEPFLHQLAAKELQGTIHAVALSE